MPLPDSPFNPDPELLRRLLPKMEKASDEMYRLLDRYREAGRRFRRILLYLLPQRPDTDPLAHPSTPRASRPLLEMRAHIEKADVIAEALFHLEDFNAKSAAICALLSARREREEAVSGH